MSLIRRIKEILKFEKKHINVSLSHITPEVLSSYKKLCNRGQDTEEAAKLKLGRINDLGKIVFRYQDDDFHYIIQYWDMFLEVNNYIAVKFWRNKNKPLAYIDYDKYKRWNDTHGLESKREW